MTDVNVEDSLDDDDDDDIVDSIDFAVVVGIFNLELDVPAGLSTVEDTSLVLIVVVVGIEVEVGMELSI